MTPIQRVQNAIRTEMRQQGVIWEEPDFYDPDVLMMSTGEAANFPAIVTAALTCLRDMADDERVRLWLEAMLD